MCTGHARLCNLESDRLGSDVPSAIVSKPLLVFCSILHSFIWFHVVIAMMRWRHSSATAIAIVQRQRPFRLLTVDPKKSKCQSAGICACASGRGGALTWVTLSQVNQVTGHACLLFANGIKWVDTSPSTIYFHFVCAAHLIRAHLTSKGHWMLGCPLHLRRIIKWVCVHCALCTYVNTLCQMVK